MIANSFFMPRHLLPHKQVVENTLVPFQAPAEAGEKA
jgi:hypothetical protein